MLNITFAGNIFNSAGNQYTGDEIAYQAFYYSDTYTKWNNKKISEFGKYNFNIGDSDFLPQSVGPNIDDKVIICFWTDKLKNRTDLDLSELSFIEITLNNSNVYITDSQLKPIQLPVCDLSYDDNITIKNDGITNDRTWIFNGITQYQNYKKYDEIIFPFLSFDSSAVQINWGDSNIEYFNTLDSEYHHHFTLAGNYHIIIKITNYGNEFTIETFDVVATFTIYQDLIWSFPVFRTVETTFSPSISGDINYITDVEYDIDGINIEHNLLYDQNFNYTFTTPGPHIVTQRIIYDNILEFTTISKDFTVYIDTIVNFYKGVSLCGPNFIDSSIIGNSPIQEYQWFVKIENEIIAEYIGEDSWEYVFPYPGIFTIIHKVKDSEGNLFGLEKIYEIASCPGGAGDNGGGGTMTPTVYVEKPLPTLTIKKLNDIDENFESIYIKLTLL